MTLQQVGDQYDGEKQREGFQEVGAGAIEPATDAGERWQYRIARTCGWGRRQAGFTQPCVR